MPTIIPPAGNGLTLRGHVQSEDYSFSASTVSGQATAPVVQTVTIGGATTTMTTTAVSQTVPEFAVTNGPVEFSSTTPDVCTVDQNGNVTALQSAMCCIRLKGRTGVREWVGGVTRTNPVTTYASNTAIENSPVYTPPPPSPIPKQSLLSYLRDQHYAAVTGVTPGSTAQRAHATANDPGFSSNGGTVNTNNFLRAQAGSAQANAGFHPFQQVALDEILVGGTTSVQWRAWITPHHYIGWRGHPNTNVNPWVYPAGSSFRHIAFELYVNYSATKWEGPLCKLLPSDVLKYLYMGVSPYPDNRTPNPSTTIVNGVSVPIALTLMHCWARLYNTYDVGADKRWVMPVRFGLVQNPFNKPGLPQETTLRPYQKAQLADSGMATGGDSGSPVFLGINGTLVPVSQVSWSGCMGAVMYSNYATEINVAMNELSVANNDPDLATLGPYAVQTVDLSEFEKYYT